MPRRARRPAQDLERVEQMLPRPVALNAARSVWPQPGTQQPSHPPGRRVGQPRRLQRRSRSPIRPDPSRIRRADQQQRPTVPHQPDRAWEYQRHSRTWMPRDRVPDRDFNKLLDACSAWTKDGYLHTQRLFEKYDVETARRSPSPSREPRNAAGTWAWPDEATDLDHPWPQQLPANEWQWAAQSIQAVRTSSVRNQTFSPARPSPGKPQSLSVIWHSVEPSQPFPFGALECLMMPSRTLRWDNAYH